MTTDQEMATERETSQLRFDAYHAYFDGRVKRAKELNRKADALARELRKAASRVVQS